MELTVLDMIQKIHTPVLDILMINITRLGDSGFIWILLAFLLLAFLIGISRLYLYVHYPSDVLAGAAIGIGLGLLVKKAEGQPY